MYIQGTGFWLKYCISLRSVLQKQGFYVQLSAFDLTHLEEFFINLVNLLTGTRQVIFLCCTDKKNVTFEAFTENECTKPFQAFNHETDEL
jgi:hypothetical protein